LLLLLLPPLLGGCLLRLLEAVLEKNRTLRALTPTTIKPTPADGRKTSSLFKTRRVCPSSKILQPHSGNPREIDSRN
jgi:hypothetical protein